MLAKLTGKNQITLPKSVIKRMGQVEYFDVSGDENRIVLTPVRINRANGIREKLAEFSLSDQDIADAVAWARGKKK